MRSKLVFYLFIFLPLILSVLAAKNNYINSNIFVCLLGLYCFIYHPFIAGTRLVLKNKIKKSEFWLNFIPFWNWKYFSYLFFN